jgi:hypothetical protein
MLHYSEAIMRYLGAAVNSQGVLYENWLEFPNFSSIGLLLTLFATGCLGSEEML